MGTQSPFTSIFMYLGEVEDKQTKEDLALIIEEVLRQRIEGVKNEQGTYITTAFPKLLYCLEEDNIHEDSPYWYLTKLAAECSAKRLVPDYISEKKMKELKEGSAFPCMGCVDGKEIVTYKYNGKLYVESFERMWDRFKQIFGAVTQPNMTDKFINLSGVEIYDTKEGFVECKRIIRNLQDNWVDVSLSGGRRVLVTDDHPFETENRGIVHAKDLKVDDQISINYNQYSENGSKYDSDLAWLLGVVICDGSYRSTISASIALTGEDEIEEKWIKVFKEMFDIDTSVIERRRGAKGNYKDLILVGERDGKVQKVTNILTSQFKGINKNDRHIPNKVFSWSDECKYAFLAGMIDADGYVNPTTHGGSVVQIGSVNKELALQQMALAQSLGMDAKVYHNHYDPKNKDHIRYRVEFVPDDTLVENIQCKKKRDNYISRTKIKKGIVVADVREVNCVYKQQYSYDVETSSGHFEFSGVYSHNCRSFLHPYYDENGKPKYYGRFNQGVVTLNLPDVALSSGGDYDKFWKILDERLELCFKALMVRHNSLKGVKSDVAPILYQHGAYARLKSGEVIDKLLYNGYSSISLGYAGLCECVKYMTGNTHTDNGKGFDFGIKVMKRLNEACNKWTEKTNIYFSPYGSPIESTTYKFAKSLQKRFGIIEGITDKKYVTNSYHVTPSEDIDAFTKLSIESKYQELSLGGAISYIETPNMTKNIEALLEVIKFIYENIMYAEINTMTSYCHECGCTDIEMKDDLKFHCPQCGNDDFNKMNIALRICGYISTNPFNEGRANDIYDRVYHLGME